MKNNLYAIIKQEGCKTLRWILAGRKKRGRPKKTQFYSVLEATKEKNISENLWEDMEEYRG